MVNWTDIHPNLTNELQWEWYDQGFSAEQTKEWAEALEKNFKVEDFAFCAWLRDEKHLVPQTIQQQGNLESLKVEYSQLLTNIHPDFNLTYPEAQNGIPAGFKTNDHWKVKQWESHNFTPEQTKFWLGIGLDKNDALYVAYLRDQGQQTNQESVKQLKKKRHPFPAISSLTISHWIRQRKSKSNWY